MSENRDMRPRSRALRLAGVAAATALALGVFGTPAALGLTFSETTGTVTNAQGEPETRASSHPRGASATMAFSTVKKSLLGGAYELDVVEENAKNLVVDLPPGFIGNPTATARCAEAELAGNWVRCPAGSQVGYVRINAPELGGPPLFAGLFNMEPREGAPATFAFNAIGNVIHADGALRTDSDYGVTIRTNDMSQGVTVNGAQFVLWGVPADPVHDEQRCATPGAGPDWTYPVCSGEPGEYVGPHSVDGPEIPLLVNASRCTADGPTTRLWVEGWNKPGIFNESSFTLPPLERCDRVPFDPTISLAPSSLESETPTGLAVEVKLPQAGLLNPDAITQSHVKKATVALPEGVTVNASAAEGLGVCTTAQYNSETATSKPGDGCPNASKVGSVLVETPLLDEKVEGALYLAEQDDPSTTTPKAENPFDSLLAVYLVAKHKERGIVVKLAGKVETDKQSGRIVTSFDNLPQLPFSKFTMHFREGGRAPLVTPPTCGTYSTTAEFVPWSAADPDNPTAEEIVTTSSAFQITKGVGGGPCPSGGIPPFNPGFVAGTLNNNAGTYSPVSMRLTRADGEQSLTKFSAQLPQGLLAKLAGVTKCSDAAIAAAAGKRGRDELASPSCPASSLVGSVEVGAGVGSVLTYVGGKIYLAGPYKGAPLSIAVVTPAVAGPFDVGTVVIREGLTLDPVTAEVEVDGDLSDPIPHILEGVPLKVRDLRVDVDRPSFTLNPTSCDPSEIGATVFGSFADVFSPADDRPVALGSRFQAANCATLGFKPKLSLNLKGGTKRGSFPALKAVMTPRPGDANLGETVLRLPRSAFLEQGHIRTVCTRVQFAANACPEGAVYGKVMAWSPLVDEPFQGPIYLRSSDNKLPDLVFDLHGIVDIEVSGRIDSVRGGVRATFPDIPDAPISRVVIEMQGGKKGLIVNSRNLCRGAARAEASLTGQNGKAYDFRPVLKPSCGKKGRKGKG